MTNPDELERLARAATPGPWGRSETHMAPLGWTVRGPDREAPTASGRTITLRSEIATVKPHPQREANAAFIAAANPATVLALLSANREMREREEALNEALTPSGDTKAAYHGEFTFQVTQWRENEDPDSDEEMEAYLADFTVPWDTVKEIMAAIKARSALTTQREDGE